MNIPLPVQKAGGIEGRLRKRYDKTFKAKVALKTLRGEKTVQEIATTYQVRAALVTLKKYRHLYGFKPLP